MAKLKMPKNKSGPREPSPGPPPPPPMNIDMQLQGPGMGPPPMMPPPMPMQHPHPYPQPPHPHEMMSPPMQQEMDQQMQMIQPGQHLRHLNMDMDMVPMIPTHPCIRVRNSHDAHVIMEAVRRKILPLINRRLTPAQRKDLGQNGSVFVWEKIDHPAGIKRWDDSLRWRPGLNINPFEIFEERGELMGGDRKNAKTRPDKNQGRPKGTSYLRPSRRPDVPVKPNGMTRQVYTADVLSPTDATPRRWHLVSYYRKSELDLVPTIETDHALAHLVVPPGVFRPVTKNIRSLKNPIPVLSIPGETDAANAAHNNSVRNDGSGPMGGVLPHLENGMSAGYGAPGLPGMGPPDPYMRNRSRSEDDDVDEDMDEDLDADGEDEGYVETALGLGNGSGSGRKTPSSVVPNSQTTAAAVAAAVSYARGESFARGEPPLQPLSGPGTGPPPAPPAAHVTALQYPQSFRAKEGTAK